MIRSIGTDRVTVSPYGAFLRTRKSCPFSMYEKRKSWGTALQVKNRLNFKSQSSPQPYAFEQYRHYATVPMGKALQGLGKCYLHGRVKWSNVQKRNLAIYNQSYNTFYFLFCFGVYTPRKNPFQNRTKCN